MPSESPTPAATADPVKIPPSMYVDGDFVKQLFPGELPKIGAIVELPAKFKVTSISQSAPGGPESTSDVSTGGSFSVRLELDPASVGGVEIEGAEDAGEGELGEEMEIDGEGEDEATDEGQAQRETSLFGQAISKKKKKTPFGGAKSLLE